MMIDNFATKFLPVDLTDKDAGVRYYCKQFLSRTLQMFRYPVIPESIPKRDLELLFQVNGFAVLTKVTVGEDKIGRVDLENGTPYAFFGGLGGMLNEYYNPTIATVANPFLNFSATLTDGVDCVIVWNDSMHAGLMEIFRRYATQLVENDISLNIADINARIVSLFEADNDIAKKAVEEFIKSIKAGKLAAASTKPFFDGIRAIPYATGGSTNTITQLIEFEQYLKAGVLNDVGLNANYNMKREAINSTEAQMGTDALLPLTDDMLFNRRYGFKRAKDVLNLDFECEFGSAWEDRHDIADARADDEPAVEETGESVDDTAPETEPANGGDDNGQID